MLSESTESKSEAREKYAKILHAFARHGHHVSFFESATAAAEYITEDIQCVHQVLRDTIPDNSANSNNFSVGFGDSKTLDALKLDEKLTGLGITVHNPARAKNLEDFLGIARHTLTTDVFLTSVNAAAESGEMVNIDGTGNRVAGSLFGHRKVFFVLGTNKIARTLDEAIYRARNVAAPRNARRHRYKTPCAMRHDGSGELAAFGDCNRCYDCASPDRICNSLVIYLRAERFIESEVILINEPLGL